MFSAETLHFLTDLRSNNSRDWFQANRARYDAHVAGAAQGFGDALAAEPQRLAGLDADRSLEQALAARLQVTGRIA